MPVAPHFFHVHSRPHLNHLQHTGPTRLPRTMALCYLWHAYAYTRLATHLAFRLAFCLCAYTSPAANGRAHVPAYSQVYLSVYLPVCVAACLSDDLTNRSFVDALVQKRACPCACHAHVCVRARVRACACTHMCACARVHACPCSQMMPSVFHVPLQFEVHCSIEGSIRCSK